MTDSNKYKNEIDALGKALAAVGNLDQTGQTFVLRSMADRLGLDINAVAPHVLVPASSVGNGGVTPTMGSIEPRHFMDQRKPSTDVERVACLAFYLTNHRHQRHFTTADITKLNTEAAQKEFSNTSMSVSNAEKTGHLTKAGKWGEKQLTAFGERVVNALPDREAVRQVIEAQAKRPRRKKKGAKKKVAT